MKVCLISSRFFPQIVGSGTSAYMIASQLEKRGHEVTVLTDLELKSLHKSYDLPFNVSYISQLENYAIGKSSMREPLEALYCHLTDNNFDIIHVCNFMPMMLVNILKPLINSPIIFSFFNTPVNHKRAMGYSSLHEVDTSLASYILKSHSYRKLLLGSNNYVNTAIALGVSREEIIYCPLGVETELLESSGDKNKDELFDEYFTDSLYSHEKYLLLPSRAVEQKGLIEAVNALSIMHSKGNKIKLVLTGMCKPFDVQYAKHVNNLVATLELKDYVIIPNKPITRSDLKHVIEGATCVIVPSYFEGLGMAALEAQMLGTPLIASDIEGLNEVVVDEHNGLLCKPGNPNNLAEKILLLIENEQLASKIAGNGKITSNTYSAKNFTDIVENLYMETIARGLS